MRIQQIYFTADAFVMYQGQAVKRLVAGEKLDLDLDIPTLSVRVNDRTPNGLGVYHVPLACLRQWMPVAEERAIKKAAGQ